MRALSCAVDDGACLAIFPKPVIANPHISNPCGREVRVCVNIVRSVRAITRVLLYCRAYLCEVCHEHFGDIAKHDIIPMQSVSHIVQRFIFAYPIGLTLWVLAVISLYSARKKPFVQPEETEDTDGDDDDDDDEDDDTTPEDDPEKNNDEENDDEEEDPEENDDEDNDAEEEDAENEDAEEKDAEEKDAEEKDAEEKDAEEKDAEEKDTVEKDAEEKDPENEDAEKEDAEENDDNQDGEEEDTTPKSDDADKDDNGSPEVVVIDDNASPADSEKKVMPKTYQELKTYRDTALVPLGNTRRYTKGIVTKKSFPGIKHVTPEKIAETVNMGIEIFNLMQRCKSCSDEPMSTSL